jgi:4-hydroxy-tetrahydrodipicolinate synthase
MATLDIDQPGLIVPMLTPFTAEGDIDYGLLVQQVDVLVGHRPAMLAVAAVETQEYQYLTDRQRAELIQASARAINGRAPFLVGVSHPSVLRAGALADLAYELGATAVQILLPKRPSGGDASVSELIDYVAAIARRSKLPLVLYHNPGPGAEVAPETIVQLFRLPEVVACKESSRNLRHIGLVQSQLAADKKYYVTMEVLLAGLHLGCAGGTVPPPASFIGQRIVDAFCARQYEAAADWQKLFMVFPGAWMQYGLVAVMKTAFEALGVSVGLPYQPFGAIPEPDRQAIQAFVQSRLLLKEP